MNEYPIEDDWPTEEECRIALDACLAKKWVQVLDEDAITHITLDFREGGYLGPIYGMPNPGCVDFTEAGAGIVAANR